MNEFIIKSWGSKVRNAYLETKIEIFVNFCNL